MNSSDVKIREITQSDLEEVSEVVRKAMFAELKFRKLSKIAIDEFYADNSPQNLLKRIAGNYFYVAENRLDKKIVGIIGLRKDNNNIHNRVSTFNVLPEFQHQGIGTLLFKKVKDIAQQRGSKNLVVNSSLFAEAIYKHFGFKSIKEVWHSCKDGSGYYTIWMEQDL